MELGGVGRSKGRATVAGSVRPATTVKLSRVEMAWGISRAADARVAMFAVARCFEAICKGGDTQDQREFQRPDACENQME